MRYVALDVGGANVKFSDGAELAASVPFELWRHPDGLSEMLRSVLCEAGEFDGITLTMTGELADCFATKTEGVRFIIRSVSEVASGRSLRVYLSDGRLVPPQLAVSAPLLAAAANWHALARFAGRYAPAGAALVLDIGSTTCDIVPLSDGRPAARGKNDTERLLAGELVYTGVERSPVCGVARHAVYRGETCPLAQELFATMRDVYLVLGLLREDAEDRRTADGRPATRGAAMNRLARMICADEEQFAPTDAVVLAESVAGAQAALLSAALARVIAGMAAWPRVVIVSGHGDFLARRVLEDGAQLAAGTSESFLGGSGPTSTEQPRELGRRFERPRPLSLSEVLGPAKSRAATAYALAVLAAEEAFT
jgi:probable H4MPT-linked C1 transfer pathway protein